MGIDCYNGAGAWGGAAWISSFKKVNLPLAGNHLKGEERHSVIHLIYSFLESAKNGEPALGRNEMC
jgi:hypothetical protein